jgi:polysaccharide export outer membrane protein
MSVDSGRTVSREFSPSPAVAPIRSARRRRIQATGAIALLLCAAALGCSTTPMPPPKREWTSAYIVGAPDELRVVVLPDPAIERDVRVRPDGMISIDLIGDVPAGGRTVAQIASDVEQRIARFKRGASVSISLVVAASNAITVLGEVRTPSTFPLFKDTRAAEAIGQVGGPNFTAATRNIRVVRSGGGEAVVLRVNLSAIQGGDQRSNLVLMEGDIVYVPPTWWAQIGYVIQAILFPFNPLLGLGTAAAGSAIVP